MKILIDNDDFGGAPAGYSPLVSEYPDNLVLVDRDEWRKTIIKTISELPRPWLALKTRESLVRTLLRYLEDGIQGWKIFPSFNDMTDRELYGCLLTLRRQLKEDSDSDSDAERQI